MRPSGSSEISFIRHWLKYSFEHQHIHETVESFLEKTLFSDLLRIKAERSGDCLGAKDIPSLVDDPPGKVASKMSHDQHELERFRANYFQGIIGRCQKCVDAQGITFTDEQYM